MRKTVVVAILMLVLIAGGLATFYVGQGGTLQHGSSSSSSATSTQSSTGSGEGDTTNTTSSIGSTTSSASARSTGSQASAASSPIKHVMIIVMENEAYSSVIGNVPAPYETLLASQYAVAADYFAVSHPSLPNYLALVAGATFGVNSDCLPSQCSLPNTTIANAPG